MSGIIGAGGARSGILGQETIPATISVDTINEKTSGNGVDIDGLKLKDQNIQRGSNVGISTDSSGRLNFPSQPVFYCAGLGGIHNTKDSWEIINNWTEVADIGGNFTGGIFTAPIDGKYQYSYSLQLLSSGASKDNELRVKVGSTYYYNYFLESTRGVAYAFASQTNVVSMSASDTLRIEYFLEDSGTIPTNAGFQFFSGHLIA